MSRIKLLITSLALVMFTLSHNASARFLSEDPLGFAAGDVNFYAYVGNNPINRNDPSGKLFFQNVLNGFSRNPIPQQDLTRITNFTNAVGVTGTGVAAAPFVAGDAAGLLPAIGSGANAISGPALTSGVIGGTTGALGTLATGGDGRDVAINTGVGFTFGLLAPGLPGSGFLANSGKGFVLGGVASSTAQSIDIGTNPSKTFQQDFSAGRALGSAIGGGIASGLTAPFGSSLGEQISAGIFSFGITTPIDAVSQSLSTPSASGGFVLYPSKPNTNQLRSVYAK